MAENRFLEEEHELDRLAHERREMLEARLLEAEKNNQPIEFSLLVETLGIEDELKEGKPEDMYYAGVNQREELSNEAYTEILERVLGRTKSKRRTGLVREANAYEKERQGEQADSAQSSGEERSVQHRRVNYQRERPYTQEQHQLDERIREYKDLKRPVLSNYNEAYAFVEKFIGPTLIGEGGKSIPLRECKHRRIIAVALGMSDTADKRLRVFKERTQSYYNSE